jgi:hypothetical protein
MFNTCTLLPFIYLIIPPSFFSRILSSRNLRSYMRWLTWRSLCEISGSKEAIVKMIAFWDIASYSLVKVDRRFRDAYCLHHQGDDGRSTNLRNVGLLQREYTALRSLMLSSAWCLFTYSVDFQSLKDLGRLTYGRFLNLLDIWWDSSGRVISPTQSRQHNTEMRR